MPTESSVDPKKNPQQPKQDLAYAMPGDRYFNEEGQNIDNDVGSPPVQVQEFHIPAQDANPSEVNLPTSTINNPTGMTQSASVDRDSLVKHSDDNEEAKKEEDNTATII